MKIHKHQLVGRNNNEYEKSEEVGNCSAVQYESSTQVYLVIEKVIVMDVLNLNSIINHCIRKTILSSSPMAYLSVSIF